MQSRNWFPPDLSAILSIPVITIAVAIVTGSFLAVFSWLRHPTPDAWLWALGIAGATSVLAASLLFLAKLPQYREGIFLRVGLQHLPPREQRLYRVSFWLQIPSIVVLLALLLVVDRFQ